MPVRVLPPELVDEAIDHLWDDPKALQACSLTCRAWVPSTRLHLFRTARVRKAEDCVSLSALLDSSPIIARCVRKLTIDAEYHGSDEENHNRKEDGAWVNSAVGLVEKLGRVNTLALSRMRWDALLPETKRAFQGLFKVVRTLLIFEVRFGASADVLAFLSGFPELHELYFHGVSWERESPAPSPDALLRAGDEERMNLSYLFLDPRSSPTLVAEWLLSHPSEKGLRNIQLCWRELENTKPLGDLLQASGSALEHLQIEFPEGLSEQAFQQNQLTLAHNTSLQSLYFGGLDVSADASRALFASHLFPWVAVMLSQIQSPVLREITFELELPTLADLKSLDWVRIDRELARTEFSDLLVRFYVNCTDRDQGSGVDEDIKKEIEECLPSFNERGILRVSCF